MTCYLCSLSFAFIAKVKCQREGQSDETGTTHKTHYAIKPALPENWNCCRVEISRASDPSPVSI